MSRVIRWSLVLVALASWARAAVADENTNMEPTARCAVRIIQGSHEGQGIDPKITRLRPYLEKDPFTAWKNFQLLEQKDLTVPPKATQTFALPNGKQAALTYVDHVLRPDGKHRLRLRLEVEKGAKKLLDTTFVLDEGGMVLQAGQAHHAGMLILAFSCEIPH